MTRILVTGGAGYVGSVSVEALLAAGVRRVVVVEGAAREGPPGAFGRGHGLVAVAHDTDATSSAAARVKAPE